MSGHPSVMLVFVAALATALATGLGALPFLFVKDMSRRWLGICNSIAAGFMIGASSGLVTQGANYGLGKVMIGLLLGIVTIAVVFRLVERKTHGENPILQRDSIRGVMIVLLMTVHSISEGIGVGVAYGGGETLGGVITVAIAVHNIPEGLAISLVLVPRGARVATAALWSIFSSIPQPIMAVPAFIFVEQFEQALPYGLGFAAGAMVWMSVADLLPDALKDARASEVFATTSLSIIAMLAFQAFALG